MKIIMIKDLKKVGKEGEIVEVSDGYGANFVIPQGFGKRLTEESMAEYLAGKKKEAEQQNQLKVEAQELAGKLSSICLEFEASVGKNGYMIGTISPKSIAEELKNKYGIIVDKRKFVGHYLINSFGIINLKIELYKDVIGTIKIKVKEKTK